MTSALLDLLVSLLQSCRLAQSAAIASCAGSDEEALDMLQHIWGERPTSSVEVSCLVPGTQALAPPICHTYPCLSQHILRSPYIVEVLTTIWSARWCQAASKSGSGGQHNGVRVRCTAGTTIIASWGKAYLSSGGRSRNEHSLSCQLHQV